MLKYDTQRGQRMEKVAVIMAGGQGRRFWPVSRKNKPKQFLSITGDNRSMLQNTVERLNGIVPEENIYVVTNACYREWSKASFRVSAVIISYVSRWEEIQHPV